MHHSPCTGQAGSAVSCRGLPPATVCRAIVCLTFNLRVASTGVVMVLSPLFPTCSGMRHRDHPTTDLHSPDGRLKHAIRKRNDWLLARNHLHHHAAESGDSAETAMAQGSAGDQAGPRLSLAVSPRSYPRDARHRQRPRRGLDEPFPGPPARQKCPALCCQIQRDLDS